MGFRLKVTLLCDFCAFRKTLSVLQMACSCYIWQESTRVSRRRLSLVSYCELTSHFSVGFLLSVRAFVQLHFLRNNCLSWVSHGEVVVSASFWVSSNLKDNGSFCSIWLLHSTLIFTIVTEIAELFPTACSGLLHVCKDGLKCSITSLTGLQIAMEVLCSSIIIISPLFIPDPAGNNSI